MAYRVLKHTLRQTATNAAAQVVASLIEGGHIDSVEDATSAVNEVADSIFDGLASVADEDNATLVAEQGPGEEHVAASEKKSSSSKPKSSSSSSSKGFTAADARKVELNYGKFAGETLGKVEKLTADEAEEYGYENGDGMAYIKWLSTNKRNPFLMKASKAIVAARRASSDDEDEEDDE